MTDRLPHMSMPQKLLIGLGLAVAAAASLVGYVMYDLSKMDLGKVRVFKEGIGPGYEALAAGEAD